MDSVGVFLEKEINGKPFYICTLSSQKDNLSSSVSGEAAINSGGKKDLSLQEPLFLCPSLREQAEMLKLKEDSDNAYPFTISPHYDQSHVQYLLNSNDYRDDICKHPLLPLFWCNNQKPNYDLLSRQYCRACLKPDLSTSYYLCVTCNRFYHKECVESPLFLKHPSYPFLSLHLYSPPKNSLADLWSCISCEISIGNMAYYCPTYKLSMHPFCALKPIPIVIDHFKRHPHPLTFFPKQAFLACNICGIIKEFTPTYVCVRCVFVVHQDCIYFTYVIRISRHQHRISFTYSLPSGNLSCGVCRKKVDNDYGAYSCNQCAHGYFVHSRCALRNDLWDGEELEGVPEEPEIVVEPFQRIADGIILHFSHIHHLKLEIFTVYDENKYCQACVLPIYQGNYYLCVDHCDFILHEECANAPLKKHHPLHPYSLTLKVVTDENFYSKGDEFRCNGCRRASCGFFYEERGRNRNFKLDLRCASIYEPFEYQGHEHPLYLSLTPEEENLSICQICQEDRAYDKCRKLSCIECKYIICFNCATLPYKARYKHDKHLLTFHEPKEANDHSEWCDLCERKIPDSKRKGFYSCDEYCCTTLHIDCLIGDPYLKRGQTISVSMEVARIIGNDTLSRPFCWYCKQRCRHKVVLEWNKRAFCSLSCLLPHHMSLSF